MVVCSSRPLMSDSDHHLSSGRDVCNTNNPGIAIIGLYFVSPASREIPLRSLRLRRLSPALSANHHLLLNCGFSTITGGDVSEYLRLAKSFPSFIISAIKTSMTILASLKAGLESCSRPSAQALKILGAKTASIP